MSWSSARAPRASPPPFRRATTAPRSIVVEENFDIGGHAMLSGGRVHLGGGNALQKKFNIKDSPDQVFADWTNSRARRQPLQRPRSRAHLRRRMRADLPVPARQRRHLHREADRHAGRLDRAAGLRHPRMAHPERGDRAAAQPQRLGPGPPSRRKRAQEGRADPAQARDDADRARRAQRRKRARHRRAGRRPRHRHRGQEGRRHRHRRPHRQRQLPPHVRSAAHRGIPAGRPALLVPGRRRRARRDGHRRVALGDRQRRPARSAPPSPRRATSARAGAISASTTRPTARSSISARRPA